MHHPSYTNALRGLLLLYLAIGMVSNAISHDLPNSRWPKGLEYTVKSLNFTPEITAEGGGAVRKVRGAVVCYWARSGTRQSCDFTAEVRRLPQFDGNINTNGGHTHTPTLRDLTFQKDKNPLIYYGNPDKDTTANRIDSRFDAKQNFYFFYHPLQESSGYYEVEKILYAEVGWGCVFSPDFIKYSHIHEFYKVRLGVDGLEKLPTPTAADPRSYIFVRGLKKDHPDTVAYWGTPATNYYLQEIATLYQKLAAKQDIINYPELELKTTKLSINDMSLIRGGLFDIFGAWDTVGGHQTHRNGKDADINRPVLKTGGRLPCMDNFDLRLAVDIFLPIPDGTDGTGYYPNSAINSALLCEGDLNDDGTVARKDKYHIDFEVALPDLLPATF